MPNTHISQSTIIHAGPVDIGLLVVVALIWASAFVAVDIAVPETGPLWLPTIRVLIGAAALAPFVLHSGLVLPRSARTWALVIVMAALNIVVPFFLLSWGQLTIDAGMAAVLMGMGPVLALLGNHLTTHDDKINGAKLVAVALCFSGVLTLVGFSVLGNLGGTFVLAQLATLGAALCYATSSMLIRHIDMPPVPLAWLALAIGAVMLLPAAWIIDGPPPAPSRQAWTALIYLGLLPTGLAHVLRVYLIRRIGHSVFALSIYMIPPFGVVLAFLILAEPITAQLGIALALILCGLYFAQRGSGPAAKQTSPSTADGRS